MSGHPLVDAVLAVVLAAGFLVVARWAPPLPIIVAGAAALALSGSSYLGVLAAAAAAGLGLAELIRDRWDPRLGLASAALLLVAYTQLQFPHGTGRTALATMLGLGLVWIAALAEAPRRVRRWVIGVAAVSLGLLIVAVAVAVPAALRVRTRLHTATAAADAASVAIDSGDEPLVRRRLATATTEFAAAARALDSPVLGPISHLPLLGPHVAAARIAVSAATEVSTSALRASRSLDLGGLRPVGGIFDLARIRALEQPAVRLAGEVRSSRRKLAGAGSPWLLPVVRERLADGDRDLGRLETQLETVARVARVAPAMLGGEGARRYFLALQNPAEARGGGGILGSFAEITAEDGRLQLGRVGQATELHPRKGTELQGPADYLERYAGSRPEEYWQNMTVSPDFPTDAAVIEAMYPSVGGPPIDGVISLDPAALAALLRALGPVSVAGLTTDVSAGSVEQLLLHDQYRLFPDRPDRVDFLGAVVAALWGRLTSDTAVPGATEFGRQLGPAARGRHLMIHSTRPTEQALFRRLEVTGAVPALGTGDELGVVIRNGLPNKLDWYLHRSTRTVIGYDDVGGSSAEVAITLDNRTPTDGVPAYVLGPQPAPPERPAPTGTYRADLSIYTNWLLDSATLDGHAVAVQSQLELGRRVYSVSADVAASGRAEVRLRFTNEPTRASAPATVTVWHQPAVHPEAVDLRITRPGGPEQRRRWLRQPKRVVPTGLTGT